MPSGPVNETVQARTGTRRGYYIRRIKGENTVPMAILHFRGTARGRAGLSEEPAASGLAAELVL